MRALDIALYLLLVLLWPFAAVCGVVLGLIWLARISSLAYLADRVARAACMP